MPEGSGKCGSSSSATMKWVRKEPFAFKFVLFFFPEFPSSGVT
jgi:hypothetical protein